MYYGGYRGLAPALLRVPLAGFGWLPLAEIAVLVSGARWPAACPGGFYSGADFGVAEGCLLDGADGYDGGEDESAVVEFLG